MAERVKLNIGGRIFETHTDTIMKYPDTMLARYIRDWKKDDKVPFFDRNPDLFGFILDFYRNGDHTIPQMISVEDYNKELDFWGLPQVEIEESYKTHEDVPYVTRLLLLKVFREGAYSFIVDLVCNGTITFRITKDDHVICDKERSVDDVKKMLAYFFPRLEYVIHPSNDDGTVYIDGAMSHSSVDYHKQGKAVYCRILQVKLSYEISRKPWISEE